MNRRSMLKGAGLAAALPLSAHLAFAQGDAEKTHIELTRKAGATSLAQSRIALKNATNPKVQEFAKFETAEQETISNILMGMKDPAIGDSGVVTPPSQDAVMSMVPSDKKAMVQQLQGLQGADFDRQYVQAQIQGHNELLAAQQQYLDRGKKREQLNVAKLAKGMITEHLQLLQDIQSSMQA